MIVSAITARLQADADVRRSAPAPRGAASEATARRPSEVPLRRVDNVVRSPGRRLDPVVRRQMEGHLERDLGHVRIHTDAAAARSAAELDARAYSLGRAVVFASGEYRPHTAEGRQLLAHELTHVVQQPDGHTARAIASPDSAAEHEAHRAAATLGRGRLANRVGSTAAGVVHRQPRGECPSCHAPGGTQWVTFETVAPRSLNVRELPDAAAVEFASYLAAGYTFQHYKGCDLASPQAIRNHDYDGSSYLVGYLLPFSNPEGSNFASPKLILDLHGNILDERWHSPDGAESVLSPVDFIGPALLEDLVYSAGRGILAGSMRAGVALGSGARNLAFAGRVATSDAFVASTRIASDIPTLSIRSEASVFAEATGPSFADLSSDLGLEPPGTVTYGSTADAAQAARTAGLESTTSPGFQTHATASAVRAEFGVTGRAFQSAHLAPQALYRGLRAAGIEASEGRALTTLLPRAAHAAMDGGWVAEWNAAVRTGQRITARDVYSMVSRSVDAVGETLINAATKGAIKDRLRTELFSELGLSPDFVIVPGRP